MTKETIADVRAERTKLYAQIQELSSSNAVYEADSLSDASLIDSLNKDIRELQDALETLKKERDGYSRSSDMWARYYRESEQELEEINAVLDVLPNPPPRAITIGNQSPKDISAIARFASWLASRK